MNEKPRKPDFLYKYRSMANETDWNRVRQIIIGNTIYLPSPDQLEDDPFELRPQVATAGDAASLRRVIMSVAPGITELQAELFLNQLSANKGRDAILEYYRQNLEPIIHQSLRQLGVLSLSTQPDNEVLWAQYADNLKGLCLSFRVDGTLPLFGSAMPVRYVAGSPRVDYDNESNIVRMAKMCLTKTLKWSYQDEWRIVLPAGKGGRGLHSFDRSLLTEVLLGPRMPQDVIDMVISWSEERNPSVPVYAMIGDISSKSIRKGDRLL